MIRRSAIITVFLAVLLPGSTAWSQLIYGQPASGNPQLVYTHWSADLPVVGEVSASQWYMPIFGFVPLQDDLELQLYAARSSTSYETNIAEFSLVGLSDLKLQINKSLSDDQIVLSGGVNLPVGKTELSLDPAADEWKISSYLSKDYVDFPIRRLGAGFGFNLLVGGAAVVGQVRIGGSVSYQFNGAYKPYEGSGDYNPGNIFSINGGGQVQSGRVTWSANLAFSAYGTDTQDGINVLKQGSMIGLGVGANAEFDNYALQGGVSYLIRGRASVHEDDSLISQLKHYGDEFEGFGRVRFGLGQDMYLAPSISIQMIADNELAELVSGSSSIIGLGADVGREFSDRFRADLGFEYFTGSALDGEIDLSGYQMVLSLTATL
ncbi:MAG: hypothetical protein JSU65_12870 [Candidatus Zixiibacteriota bacterium]|nr:MAG: hypothetical protein JSU65_12870 [candidate division Zixibacteria bacterium]